MKTSGLILCKVSTLTNISKINFKTFQTRRINRKICSFIKNSRHEDLARRNWVYRMTDNLHRNFTKADRYSVPQPKRDFLKETSLLAWNYKLQQIAAVICNSHFIGNFLTMTVTMTLKIRLSCFLKYVERKSCIEEHGFYIWKPVPFTKIDSKNQNRIEFLVKQDIDKIYHLRYIGKWSYSRSKVLELNLQLFLKNTMIHSKWVCSKIIYLLICCEIKVCIKIRTYYTTKPLPFRWQFKNTQK